jgi:hypothetical protein
MRATSHSVRTSINLSLGSKHRAISGLAACRVRTQPLEMSESTFDLETGPLELEVSKLR